MLTRWKEEFAGGCRARLQGWGVFNETRLPVRELEWREVYCRFHIYVDDSMTITLQSQVRRNIFNRILIE